MRGIVSCGSAFITVFSTWVPEIDGLVTNVAIQIQIALETDWVFASESPNIRVVVSGAVEVEVGLGVEFASGVPERIHQRARRGR